ncbi:polyketide synthase dehydratase domain-containing protein, partial [Micromonospora sp. NPDC047620]|uniref:polyketide synthase dehydratase domain-containing protein n=1 Tax=Micromonospora sp. NPDC047620 TaxID=3364251 RepID=UPI00371B73A1
MPVDDFYPAAADAGYDYGPTFQGLRQAWQHDGTLYADITISDTHHDNPDDGGHAIHPALLDAALHPLLLAHTTTRGGTPLVPFTWTGVTIHTTGATHARAILTQPTPDTATITLHHTDGTPLATINHLQLRPLPTTTNTTLLNLHWRPATGGAGGLTDHVVVGPDPHGVGGRRVADLAALREAINAGVGVPAAVVTPDLADAHTTTVDVLALVQEFLAAPEFHHTRLVVLTTGATSATAPTGVDATRSAAAGALWGLLRVVQAEHPGRVVVADVDEPAARHLSLDEPQQAVTAAGRLVPRLAAPTGEPIPVSGEWRLTADGSGSLDGIVVETVTPDVVGAGEVRVAIRAAGVNFRDVLVGLGVYPGGGSVGV